MHSIERIDFFLKKNVSVILLIFLSFSAFPDEISIGDSMKDIMAGVDAEDYMGMSELGLWPENEYHVYALENNGQVLLSMNFYPFGVLASNGEDNYFLIDFDGDSFLDFKSTYLYVPPWVISLNSKGFHDGDFMIDYLELTTIAFQSDELPSDTDEMKRRTEQLIEVAEDTNSADRVFVYFDYLYNYLYNRDEYEAAYYCLQNLFQSLDSLMNETILIYMVELAYRNDQLEEAKGLDDILIENFPNFIPGLIYQYILEDDAQTKEKYKNQLLSNYPNHWMVNEKVR